MPVIVNTTISLLCYLTCTISITELFYCSVTCSAVLPVKVLTNWSVHQTSAETLLQWNQPLCNCSGTSKIRWIQKRYAYWLHNLLTLVSLKHYIKLYYIFYRVMQQSFFKWIKYGFGKTVRNSYRPETAPSKFPSWQAEPVFWGQNIFFLRIVFFVFCFFEQLAACLSKLLSSVRSASRRKKEKQISFRTLARWNEDAKKHTQNLSLLSQTAGEDDAQLVALWAQLKTKNIAGAACTGNLRLDN